MDMGLSKIKKAKKVFFRSVSTIGHVKPLVFFSVVITVSKSNKPLLLWLKLICLSNGLNLWITIFFKNDVYKRTDFVI